MPPAGETLPGERRLVKPSNPKGNGNGKAPPKAGKAVPGPSAGSIAGVRKVAHFRDAVESGAYRVEARKVADKIVKDAVLEIRSRLQ